MWREVDVENYSSFEAAAALADFLQHAKADRRVDEHGSVDLLGAEVDLVVTW